MIIRTKIYNKLFFLIKKTAFLLFLFSVVLFLSNCAVLMEEDRRADVLTQRIGYHVHTEVVRNFVLVHDPVIEGELAKLAQKISSRTPKRWQVREFHIINSSGLNVFAVPDGSLFITSGFLDLLSSPGELAYVIARAVMVMALSDDMAYIVSENMSSSSGAAMKIFLSDTLNFAAALSLTFTTGTPTQMMTVPEQTTQLEQMWSVPVSYAFPYIINQEYEEEVHSEADRQAVLVIERAGYDSKNAIIVLEKCETFRQSNIRTAALSPFISTKPDLEDRIEMVKEFLSKR